MPSLTGRVEVNLTVRDPVRSAEWYAALLGMRRLYEYAPDDGRPSYSCLADPGTGFVLCLVGHPDNPGDAFSEQRTGLDHLEFLVDERTDLDSASTTPA